MVRYSLCAFCKHFRRQDRGQDTCAAYPGGVPADFIAGRRHHVLPAEGDHGIQFELADDLPESCRSIALRVVETAKASSAAASAESA